jgi:hypothetical protein
MERKLTITLLLLMVIVYVSALTILMYLAPEYSPIENPQHEIKPAYNITIIIDYGNGSTQKFTGINLDPPNTTVLHALLLVASVEYHYEGPYVFIDAINGVRNNENNNNMWWQYWVNGELPMVAANKYYLNSDDIVEWKYWPSQFSNITKLLSY